MKSFIKIILVVGISSFLLIGCSTKKQEKTIDNFINNLISTKTYENITSDEADKFTEESKDIFKEYLSDDAFENLITNRIPYIYYNVINKNNIKDTTDIKIVKTKETDNDKYTYYEYEVTYKLKSDDKSKDMTDYMVFKINEDNKSMIAEFHMIDKTSSIFKELKNTDQ
ncbi:MAG: hypothetical protein E7212_00525 [Clostridium sartagoforme]|nr:hypothetical protein [Clostridium sartagoforme]